MRPTADEVLKSVIWTFDTYIAPEVEEPFAQSLTLTVSNLLRHVLVRMEREGPALFEDNREIRAVLEAILELGRSVPASGSVSLPEELVDEIEAALARSYHGVEEYPTLAMLTAEATDLRWALDHALRALQKAEPEFAGDSGYQRVRVRIREYLAHQLGRQLPWIVEAFVGERR